MVPTGVAKVPGGSPPPEQLSGVLGEILLTEAARLARRGRWVEAEAALGFPLSSGEPTRGAALDLLARIRAQQGQWAEAREAWAEALRLEPENETYLSGLRLVSHPLRFCTGGWLMLLLVAVAGAIGLTVVFGFWNR